MTLTESRTIDLWLKFLKWPAIAVGFVWLAERIHSVEGDFWPRFLNRATLTLAAYAVGSIVPLLHSDEYLYWKFSSVKTSKEDQNTVTITFSDFKVGKFNIVKNVVQYAFFFGLFTWVAQLTLSGPSSALPYPVVPPSLQVITSLYFFAAGMLYVYTNNRPEFRPERLP